MSIACPRSNGSLSSVLKFSNALFGPGIFDLPAVPVAAYDIRDKAFLLLFMTGTPSTQYWKKIWHTSDLPSAESGTEYT